MLKTALLAFIVLRQFLKTQTKGPVIPVAVVDGVINQAMGYAWEVGHGQPLNAVLDATSTNPFLNPGWRGEVS